MSESLKNIAGTIMVQGMKCAFPLYVPHDIVFLPGVKPLHMVEILCALTE